MLAGTNVTRATLNNQDFINKMDIRIGDTITVRKSGDIIPQITSVLYERRPDRTAPYISMSSTLMASGRKLRRALPICW